MLRRVGMWVATAAIAQSACHGESAADAPLGPCAGLGCSDCPSSEAYLEIDLGPVCGGGTCDALGNCPSTLPDFCVEELGIYPHAFLRGTCTAGVCIYAHVDGACEDLTLCDECLQPAIDDACFSRATAAECGACCYWADAFAQHSACACATGGPCDACAGSSFCGGVGPETNDCVRCLAAAVSPGGACNADPTFQAACIQSTDTRCRDAAQCLFTCGGL
jgi:hypothetical protein